MIQVFATAMCLVADDNDALKKGVHIIAGLQMTDVLSVMCRNFADVCFLQHAPATLLNLLEGLATRRLLRIS